MYVWKGAILFTFDCYTQGIYAYTRDRKTRFIWDYLETKARHGFLFFGAVLVLKEGSYLEHIASHRDEHEHETMKNT